MNRRSPRFALALARTLLTALALLVFTSTPVRARADEKAPNEPKTQAEQPPGTRPGAEVHKFGAGSKRGGFTRIAKALKAGLESTPVDIDIVNTKGSCDNIRLLLHGDLDFGLVQYDVAAEAFKAAHVGDAVDAAHGDEDEDEGDASEPGGWMCRISAELAQKNDLRLVAALTDGAVHVLVRRPVRLDSFDAIGDHQIYIGKNGSGSFETGKVIVGAAGLTVQDLNRLEGVGSSKALEAMRNGDLLVMLRTTEPGHKDIAKLLATGVASVNPLPDDILNRLIDGYPYYRVCQIEPNVYPGLEFGMPTVCVSTVLLTTVPLDHEDNHVHDRAVSALLTAAKDIQRDKAHNELKMRVSWRGFAEQEPIPLHLVAEEHEFREQRDTALRYGGMTLVAITLLLLIRRYLRRRGLLRDSLNSNFEGQLSNPLVPFGMFAVLVLISTVIVWSIEHDSNAHLRTLDDSFWEINTFATGNFSAETVKSSTARFIGALATIAGLGFLAWFTAALTNLFGRDQTRLFARLKNHVVILNFREDMVPLIRLLRSPGPAQSHSLHVVISDALPKRVRLHLAKIKGLVIHHSNPEVPRDLQRLRLSRAARVVVLQGDERYDRGTRYHPLRITRAVHQACGTDHYNRMVAAQQEVSSDQSAVMPALLLSAAGHQPPTTVLPATLVEAGDHEPRELFDPFRGWVIPVRGQELADAWLATAAADTGFPQLFHNLVSFDENNSEVYTAELPEWFHGLQWRRVRRVLYSSEIEGKRGAIPVGLYRQEGTAETAGADLQQRLRMNPALDTVIEPGDRVVAIAEDADDLANILKRSLRLAQELG